MGSKIYFYQEEEDEDEDEGEGKGGGADSVPEGSWEGMGWDGQHQVFRNTQLSQCYITLLKLW